MYPICPLQVEVEFDACEKVLAAAEVEHLYQRKKRRSDSSHVNLVLQARVMQAVKRAIKAQVTCTVPFRPKPKHAPSV